MSRLIPVTEPPTQGGQRPRISRELITEFMESGHPMVQVDRTDLTQSRVSLNAALTAYVKSHKLPIRVWTANGEVYLARIEQQQAPPAEPAPQSAPTAPPRIASAAAQSLPAALQPDTDSDGVEDFIDNRDLAGGLMGGLDDDDDDE